MTRVQSSQTSARTAPPPPWGWVWSGVAASALLALLLAGCSRFEPLPATDSQSGFEVQDFDAPTRRGEDAVSDAGGGLEAGPTDDAADDDTGHAHDGSADETDGEETGDATVPPADAPTPDDAGDASGSPDADEPGDSVTPSDLVDDADDALVEVPDDVGPCEDTCPEEDLNRCATDTEVPAIERCLPDPTTGCLAWQLHAECGEPADLCAGTYVCEDGACVIPEETAVVCTPPADQPCTSSTCNPETGACEEVVIPELGSCDDGDPCTVLEKCDADGNCTNGLPNSAACPCSQDADCVVHDLDGDACNGRYTCGPFSACVQEPEPIVCPDSEVACQELTCAPETGECVPGAVEDGLACDDLDACSGSSTCQAGECTGADWLVCEVDDCEDATCDPLTGTCEVEVLDACCGNGVPEGEEQCDDGDPLAPACDDSCLLPTCAPAALGFQDSCVLIQGAGLLPQVTDATVEFFIRPAPVSQESTLLDREATAGPGDLDWRIGVVTIDGQPRLSWHEGRISLFDVNFIGPALAVSQWQHVAIVRDITDAGGGIITFYVDGQPAASESFLEMEDLGSSLDIWLGCEDGFTGHFAGTLDELAIHSGTKYDAPFAPPALPLFVAESTELLLHFDHAIPGVSVDATGGGHDGLWQGATAVTSHAFEDGELGSPASCDAPWCSRSALRFDPAAEGVATAASEPGALAGVQTLTLEAFVSLDAAPGPGEELWLAGTSVGGPGAPDWHVVAHTAPTGQIRLKWIEGQVPALFDNFVSSVSSLEPGVVRHIAVVREFVAPGEATIRWFFDGVPESAIPLSGALALGPPTTLHVGSDGGTASFLDGSIDELRITAGVVYDEAFPVPEGLSARWDTLGLYRFDVGAGTWTYPERPSTLPPLVLEGVEWLPDGLTGAASPCP